ncbi:MAG: phosphatidate cytidylyltransferase [Thermodesulfobacteriota bacterium]
MAKTAHLKRWLTSIIALPLLILLIVKGGTLLFALLIGLVTVAALWEYYRIAGVPASGRGGAWLPVLGYATGCGIIWGAFKGSFGIMLGFVVLDFFAAAAGSLKRFSSDAAVSGHIIRQFFGSVYVPVLLSSLVLIRNGVEGIPWIFMLLGVVFAGDVAAYYVGTYLGRHKLCPAISPGKTIEGAFGGLAGNLLIGSLFKSFFLPQLPWLLSLLCFACLGLMAQAGDLFESELKRAGKVKDSGVILPGHGGILDRIDALLFAAPLAYIFKEFLLKV